MASVFWGLMAWAEEGEARQPATQMASRPAVRFGWVDVYVDSRADALAAYQFELTAEAGEVAIVGIEGGEHLAFADPPYYDPAALTHNRVIVAAFNTGSDLPTGKTRIARIHVQITGEQKPVYAVQLSVAASADGQPISGATVSVAEGESK